MRKIKDIQADKKKLREAYLANIRKLDTELAEVRAANANAKKAKGGAQSRPGDKAKASHKPQDSTKESARRAADVAKERMKAAHPDTGGPGGASFCQAYSAWKTAEARYQAVA
jgi:septal ring factor EnvC (AmiA/AmiB activator)